MFSATLSKEIRPVCKKFMNDPMEVYVDDDTKLTLHGLRQHFVNLKEQEKNRKLFDLLDALEFNQVVIFVKSVQRCIALNQLLKDQNFPSIDIHRSMNQKERLERYSQFKNFQRRILVATNLFGRGIDIERVNIRVVTGAGAGAPVPATARLTCACPKSGTQKTPCWVPQPYGIVKKFKIKL